MSAAMESTAMESAAVESATMESATMESATMEFAAVESVTVEPVMEPAEAFAAESAIAEVRGIAVASVVPPSVETSRQAKNRNQKGAKDNQFYFHYLIRRQAGRMTSEAEDIPFAAGLATAGPAFRTPAGVPT
jgi:hypothetical protein